MDPERWKRAEDLFQSALEQRDDEAEHFVRQKCAGDKELEEEVLSLLSSHRKSGNFLEPPTVDLDKTATQADYRASPHSPPVIVGQTVSHYRVLGRLGSGGMGVIYEAEDIKLTRRVAMKFLPDEVASDRVAFERLQREARAASALEHSNICPIYEFGDHQGRHFIVMQLLEGQTLRQWIDDISPEKRNEARHVSRSLDLATQIANGLEVAHNRGIIHRDIKPANIFVTTRGDAKILDFGLAKVLKEPREAEHPNETSIPEATRPISDSADLNLTRAGTTMGTAYYMSPEQIRAEELDTRTDLFSLGLVLYEMVTGQRAFAGETSAAVHDAILHQEPTPARRLNPGIPASLEKVIDKAVEKERARRYQSAREMANDLESVRGDFNAASSRRRPNWVAGAALSLLVLAVVAGFLERAWSPAKHELSSSVKARRSVAVLGFRNLGNTPDADWISTALEEMMSTELAAGQQLRVIPGENVAHMKLDLGLGSGGIGPDALSKIRKYLGTDLVVQGSYLLSSGNSLRVDLQAQDANGGETIASASENGSEVQIAALVSQAGAALRKQLGISAVKENEIDSDRAILPADMQAARLYSEGLAKLHVFDALAARDLLTKAIALDPNHALSHSLLAESLSALGFDDKALAEAKEAFDLSHGLPRDHQLMVEGRYRELSHDYPAAMEAYRSLWKFFPDDLDYGLRLAGVQTAASLGQDALHTIAQMRGLPEPTRSDPRIDLAEGGVAESLGDFKRSLEVVRVAGDKAKRQGSRLLLSQARVREGWALDRLGELDLSIAAYSEARDLAQAGGNLRASAAALSGMGTANYDKGNLEGARKAYEEGLMIARQVGAQRVIANATSNIGNVFFDQGKFVEARQHYEDALAVDRAIDDKRDIASDLGNLANVLQGMGDLRGATKMQEQTLQAFRDVGDRRGEGATAHNLGDVLAAQGEIAAAQQRLNDALSIYQQIGFRRGRASVLTSLSDTSVSQNRLSEARSQADEALTISKELQNKSGIALAQAQLARVALEQGDAFGAETLARNAAAEFKGQKSVDNECISNTVVGRALLAQGKTKDAQAATDLALSLCQEGQDREALFDAEIASATVKFKAGDVALALKMLEKVQTESARLNYVAYEFESRFLLGEIELASEKPPSGRTRLEKLSVDAQQKGWLLIAHKIQTRLNIGAFTF